MQWEKRTLGILTFIAITIGIGLTAWSRAVYYHADADFMSFYADVRQFGEDCGWATGDWHHGDTAEEVRTVPHALTPLKMPYRRAAAADKPEVKPDQYLYTQCYVDLSALKPDGFAWMRIHQALGDSAVFLNGTLRMVDSDNGDFEFPLLPSDRKPSTLEIISRPINGRGGWLGLATGMPMLFTDSRAALVMPNLLTYRDLVLKPIYWFNFALVFLMIFGAAWIAGIRYPEVGWMVVCAMLDALMSYALFSPDNNFPIWMRQVNAIAGLARNLSFAAAVASFFRLRVPKVGMSGLFFIVTITYTGLLQIDADAAIKSQLYRYMPWYVNVTCFGAITFAAMKLLQKNLDVRTGRHYFMTAFSGVFGLAQIINIFAYQKLGTSFSVPVMETGWIAFGLFLILDISVFYRRFLEERLRRRDVEIKSKEHQAIAAMTQMFAHDVRRPFSIIMALIDRLRSSSSQKLTPAQIESYANSLRRDVRSVNTMIADLMDLGHDLKVCHQECNPLDVINSALDLVLSDFSDRREKHAVQVETSFKHSKPLVADTDRLHRVITNILGNACEAMDYSGKIIISTKDCQMEDAATLLSSAGIEIAVANNGPAISPEDLSHIFDSFFTRGKTRGTGLGLAIAKKIVDAHRGTISCESTPESTVFTIKLPVEVQVKTLEALTGPSPSALKVLPQTATKTPDTSSASACRKIVIVEDNLFYLENWRQVLVSAELECHRTDVLTFSSPETFWSYIGDAQLEFFQDKDAIVIDFYFNDSETNGADIARAIRSLLKQARLRRDQCPAIYLSSDLPESAIPSVIGKNDQDVGDLFDGVVDKDPYHFVDILRRLKKRCP